MNKFISILLISLLFVVSVNAFVFIPPVSEEDAYNSFLQDTGSYQTDLLYEDIWDSYLSGNLSRNSYKDLTQATFAGIPQDYFVAGEGEEQFIPFYEDLTSSELKELKYILLSNNYIFPGNDAIIDQYIAQRSDIENQTYTKYLEYEAVKNIQKKNINAMWVHIVSFTQLLIEILNIGIYLAGFFLFVFVVIEAIPNALIFMRNKILENYMQKKGFRK